MGEINLEMMKLIKKEAEKTLEGGVTSENNPYNV